MKRSILLLAILAQVLLFVLSAHSEVPGADSHGCLCRQLI